MLEQVVIEKLVHGGQGIGTLADGRRVFVWNALPGECVMVQLGKRKKHLAEGIATEIIEASAYRIAPLDEAYLSTSPWQILDFDEENRQKRLILQETMQREHVAYDGDIAMRAGELEWKYRNKMEYSFWADDSGLNLALFNRGSHQKQVVTGSSIAMPIIDEVAQKIVRILNDNVIRGSQLKTIVVRASQQGEAVAALFVKDESFPYIAELDGICSGVAVYYSTPKSPASVLTKELYVLGTTTLTDTIGGYDISYDVNSFFQVNIDVFNLALQQIKQATEGHVAIDMYAGVGTIGIPVGASYLIEIDTHNIAKAQSNAITTGSKVIHAPAEKAIEYINADGPLIVDPPRAGLHADMVKAINEVKPTKVVYLSCNPITQARDLALLQDNYKIISITGYNFFPRTPHIESLAILERI